MYSKYSVVIKHKLYTEGLEGDSSPSIQTHIGNFLLYIFIILICRRSTHSKLVTDTEERSVWIWITWIYYRNSPRSVKNSGDALGFPCVLILLFLFLYIYGQTVSSTKFKARSWLLEAVGTCRPRCLFVSLTCLTAKRLHLRWFRQLQQQQQQKTGKHMFFVEILL